MEYRGRLTDNDTNLGPIQFGRTSGWRPISIVLCSGDDDESNGCRLTFYALGWCARIFIPRIIKPYKRWVDTSRYEWSKGPGSGYWDMHSTEYGFSVSDGTLHLYYGPQTHDSITTKSKCYFFPWREWRFYRHSFYDNEGLLLKSFMDQRFGPTYEFEQQMPKIKFSFLDYDKEEIEVETFIQEREWHRGVGYFKWLSWIVSPRIERSLDLDFSKEVGPEKGSWKGGTTGHSITMLPGEMHEAAFRRYCTINNLTFIRPSISGEE